MSKKDINGATALYERLSVDDNLKGESNSITNQKMMLESYALEKGFRHIRHYTDDGYSGTTFKRPGFTAMIEAISQDEISTVIVKDMSRLGRDYIKVGQLIQMFSQKDVRLIAINDKHDSINGDGDIDFFPSDHDL